MSKAKVFFSAGEISGDISASEIIEKLTKMDIECIGVGGKRMEQSGMVNITKTDESLKSSVGITESLRYILPKLSLLVKIKRFLKNNKPDLVILVDNQGFNIPLAKVCKKLGIDVFYYFPPMVSVWDENVKYKIAKYCDKIICTYKKDFEIYKQVSNNVFYVGSPLVDRISKNYSSKEKYLRFFKNNTKKVLLLFGSRHQEINTLTEPILEAVKLVTSGKTNINPSEIEFYTVLSHPSFASKVSKTIAKLDLVDNIKIFENIRDYALYDISDLAIASSGTTTLELAILGKPTIVVYKVSKITFEVAKRLVKVRFVSLPNIILSDQVYPELLQSDVNPITISKKIEELLTNNTLRKEIINKLNLIKNEVEGGAIDKVIDIILAHLAPLIKV
ncbi:MAG: lipid-A-disaccharide synthase [Brevinematales bacterium]|nr:lipid-A-disaccharide synthase [Brevinematales bacterium]